MKEQQMRGSPGGGFAGRAGATLKLSWLCGGVVLSPAPGFPGSSLSPGTGREKCGEDTAPGAGALLAGLELLTRRAFCWGWATDGEAGGSREETVERGVAPLLFTL